MEKRELIDICMEIGGIAGTNCHYTDGLKSRIERTGCPLEELTIREFLQITRDHSEAYNRNHQ